MNVQSTALQHDCLGILHNYHNMFFLQSTLDDYLEMFLQFGYVSLFSSVFPTAALWALVNNIVEIRTDAFNMVHVYQRPFAQPTAGIGAWQVWIYHAIIDLEYVCTLYVMLLLPDALYLGHQTFRGSFTTPGRRYHYYFFILTIKLPFIVINYNCSQCCICEQLRIKELIIPSKGWELLLVKIHDQ